MHLLNERNKTVSPYPRPEPCPVCKGRISHTGLCRCVRKLAAIYSAAFVTILLIGLPFFILDKPGPLTQRVMMSFFPLVPGLVLCLWGFLSALGKMRRKNLTSNATPVKTN